MTVSSSLPNGLRDRVLAASHAARSSGRPTPVPPEISAAEAFARAADALGVLLAALDPAQWRTRALRDLDVQGLVGHLIGVERDVERAVVGDVDIADADHVVSTENAAQAQAVRDPAQTRAEWRAAVARTLELVASTPLDDGTVLSMHGMRLSLDALLVVRAFELWTHENDIRRAIGLPAGVPDASTLALMTDLATRLLPHAAARAHSAGESVGEPVDLHLVLTGEGGGTWDLLLGEAPAGQPDRRAEVMIVADAVDFCRVVANRIAPESLDMYVDGSATDADAVLAAAASLALD